MSVADDIDRKIEELQRANWRDRRKRAGKRLLYAVGSPDRTATGHLIPSAPPPQLAEVIRFPRKKAR